MNEITTPHSLEAEQYLLGSLMIDATAFDRLGHLRPFHFFNPENRTIFQAMLDCIEAGDPIDTVTVYDRVIDGERPVSIDYLAGLMQLTATPASLVRYAEMIREKALEREILVASGEIAEIIHGQGSAREKVERAQARIMSVTEDHTREPGSIKEIVAAHEKILKERLAALKTGGVMGVRTGFRSLDKKLHGLKKGDLIVVAGRPSMGKSAFAFQVALQAADQGHRSLLLSMEMDESQIIDRYLSTVGGVNLEEVLTGAATETLAVTEALPKLASLPIHIDDQPALTLMDVRTKARRIKRIHGLDLVVIDYLQLMQGAGAEDNRNSQIEEISRGLKALAKELEVPVIALSQLNRSCEQRMDKRPMMSDLRDSGAIEQDADVIIFVYREEVYRPNEEQWRGLSELLIRKNRQGAQGDVRMSYVGSRTMFAELPPEFEWPENKPRAARAGGATGLVVGWE